MSDEVVNQETKSRLIGEAAMLVAVRKTLIEGGFTTDQAYDLIEAMLSKGAEEDDPDDDDND